jgi:DNA-binding PadR family transcriptional regulator
MDFTQCPCSGKTLARLLQPAAMAVLAAEPLHGYSIAERLQSLAVCQGHRPDPTGLYRLLKSMEKEGLVVSSWDLADSGPARRRYALTAQGRACLNRWKRTLDLYHQAVGELLAVLTRPPRQTRKPAAAKRQRPSQEV